MNTKSTILAVALGLASMPVIAASEKDCGAAGDGCAPAEWTAYETAAAQQFPDWPEVGYRTYASLCYNSNTQLKALCLSAPAKAAQALNLPPKDD